MISQSSSFPGEVIISCPVASVLYREGKEEGRRKKEEALREGKTLYGARYFPNFIHKRYQRT
ncbi:MAG: hypothetical protein F6K23_25160 [Okeania sp. SIO2C9]|uniref:hypothetical protein n=1 Tax=Okeania sp. SIO2C9 TaxID=2607791 RepID=UPI0013C03013|nr:hypothetical protein [Okeania sp. SIO2C9]NEQ76036.1 hypothetical protein [Okeania sp. SIO2C9]